VFVSTASPSVWLYVFLPGSGSVSLSVFESIKNLGPIHHLPNHSFTPPCLFLSASLLPSCFRLCIYHPSVTLQIRLSVALSALSSLRRSNYLRETDAPPLFKMHVFNPCFSHSLFLPLVFFTIPPTFLSLLLLGVLLSKEIAHKLKIISRLF